FFIDNDEDLLRASECFHDGDLTKWFCEAIDMSLKYLKQTRVRGVKPDLVIIDDMEKSDV
ncbi:MAG: hypothetical protein C0625_15455, partial [Arcobacter sp.]